MEGDRGLAGRAAALVGAAAAALCGCSLLEPSSDPDAPPPLRVAAIAPSDGPVDSRPRLRVDFATYLEDDSFRSFDAARLSSGDLRWRGIAEYSMVRNRLVWRPRSEIPEDLEVDFELGTQLTNVFGGELETPRPLATYRIEDAAGAGRPSEPPTAPDWRDVRDLFERRGCTDCHADADRGPVPLRYASLVGRRSEQVDLDLVAPFDAPDSYLLRKLIWDYPNRRFAPQPPPWSDRGEQLPDRELLRIERWIDAGAPRRAAGRERGGE